MPDIVLDLTPGGSCIFSNVEARRSQAGIVCTSCEWFCSGGDISEHEVWPERKEIHCGNKSGIFELFASFEEKETL